METHELKETSSPTQFLESPTRAELELALENLNASPEGADTIFVLVTDSELLKLQAVNGSFDKENEQWWIRTYNPELTTTGSIITFQFDSNSDHPLDIGQLDLANRRVIIYRGPQNPTENP